MSNLLCPIRLYFLVLNIKAVCECITQLCTSPKMLYNHNTKKVLLFSYYYIEYLSKSKLKVRLHFIFFVTIASLFSQILPCR